MKASIIQLIIGTVGSIGFSLVFNARRKYLLQVAAGSFLCWLSYLLCARFLGTSHTFLPVLVSGFLTALFAELMARMYKAPSTIFFMACIVPLIPGRSLYYCMQWLVEGDYAQAGQYGMGTFLTALGIALGMSAAWTICFFNRKVRRRRWH